MAGYVPSGDFRGKGTKINKSRRQTQKPTALHGRPTIIHPFQEAYHLKWSSASFFSLSLATLRSPPFPLFSFHHHSNEISYVTELLEVGADDPELHAVRIPGNPGFIRSYKDFVESLYEQLGGTASITAVGYTSQTEWTGRVEDCSH